MTRALFALHANSLPAGFEGAAPALTRYVLGDEVCALVGLPRSRWDRAMNWQAGVGRVLDRAQSARGPVGSLTKMVGAGILTQRVVGMAGRHERQLLDPRAPRARAPLDRERRVPADRSRAHRDRAGASRRDRHRRDLDRPRGGARRHSTRAREVLWRTQRPDGSWESLCDMGVMPTAQVLVALHNAGCLSARGRGRRRALAARPPGRRRLLPVAPDGDRGRPGCDRLGLGRAPRLRRG